MRRDTVLSLRTKLLNLIKFRNIILGLILPFTTIRKIIIITAIPATIMKTQGRERSLFLHSFHLRSPIRKKIHL